MATNHVDVVIAVKAQLEAAGVNLQGPCGAFEITGRVAWQLRAEGWGLVAKNPGQNGCTRPETGERYSVDALMLPDGTTIDCLINAETDNIPAWQVTGSAPVTSWRAPFDLGTVTPGPVPPPPIPTPDPEIALLRARVTTLEIQMAAVLLRLDDQDHTIKALAIRIPTGVRSSARVFGVTVPVKSELTYP